MWGDMRSYARYAWLFLSFVFSLVIPERIQTCTASSIKESDQERQRNAEEVEDLRKQLSKAAAEACLHWFALSLCGQHCMAKMGNRHSLGV